MLQIFEPAESATLQSWPRHSRLPSVRPDEEATACTPFKTRQELIDATNNSLGQFDAKFWETGFDKLILRYQRCIALDGDYMYVECPNSDSVDTSDSSSSSDNDC